MSRERSPEKLLLAWVLVRALADYLNPSVEDQHRRCARRWLFSPKRGRISLRYVARHLRPEDPLGFIEMVQNHALTGVWEPKSVCFRVER